MEDSWQKLIERIEHISDTMKIKILSDFIKQYPNAFEAIEMLIALYTHSGQREKAVSLSKQAYHLVRKILTDPNGKPVTSIPRGHHPNRPLVQIMISYACIIRQNKKYMDTLDILRYILSTNLNDNPGVRRYILAIREGINLSELNNMFSCSNPLIPNARDGFASSQRFDEVSIKYPREFETFEEYNLDEIEILKLKQQRENRQDICYDLTTIHVSNHSTIHSSKKIGRNDPCTCGSGKKRKKCCGM